MSNMTETIVELPYLRRSILHPIKPTIFLVLLLGLFHFALITNGLLGIMGYDGLIAWRVKHLGSDSVRPDDWIVNLPGFGMPILMMVATVWIALFQRKTPVHRKIHTLCDAIPLGMLLMALLLLVFTYTKTNFWWIVTQAKRGSIRSYGQNIPSTSMLGPILMLLLSILICFAGLTWSKARQWNWIQRFYFHATGVVVLLLGYIPCLIVLGVLSKWDILHPQRNRGIVILNIHYLLVATWSWHALMLLAFIWLPPKESSVEHIKRVATEQGVNLLSDTPLWQCQACQYDLTGSLLADNDTCPECGQRIEVSLDIAKIAAQKHSDRVS
ncbi:MAG: hypothetical protein CMJ19_12825 [Phycisphaeraceae bacterium]|nr:hypothetical protein [Phycisphaeraceae bacterium]